MGKMLRRKQKRQVEQPKSEKTSFKISKKNLASENSDDEDERALERLVFGGENDAIKELEKDFAEDQDRFHSSSDEVRNSVKTHRSVFVVSLVYFYLSGKVSIMPQTVAFNWLVLKHGTPKCRNAGILKSGT